MAPKLRLHSYWRSSAAYRVRIALALKGVGWETVTHDLRANEQHAPDYLVISPQGLVPALEADGTVLTQSSAILEWLEENFPDPALLPRAAGDRAIVRAMAASIACDVHPLHNLRVLRALSKDFGADDHQIEAWAAQWVRTGLEALETLVGRHGNGFAFGASPTLADCYVVPQIYAARRFKVDLAPFPSVSAVEARMVARPEVAAAHPDRQPGAPG